MSRSHSPQSPNPYSVLPPVTKSEEDRMFFKHLQTYIDDELEDVPRSDRKQRYAVHNMAFSKLIGYSQAYKKLLTRIKKEYENVISAAERGKMEAAYLNDQLQGMAQEPTTLRNYRRRSDELAKRIEVIKTDNVRLANELRELKLSKINQEQKAREATKVERRKPKKDNRNIPGLTLEESTDIPSLQRELNKVENQILELTSNKTSKFTDRQQKDELKEKLSKKVSERDILLQRNAWLIAKMKRLKVAHDAAMSYMNCTEPQYRTIADVIIMALAKAKQTAATGTGEEPRLQPIARDFTTTQIEDDDPTKEKEAELILEYIEKFNELFEHGRYEEAAIHAANSPKGILRTMETMTRFKAAYSKEDGRTPWLAFCDALMSSVLALGVKPGDAMSYECVSCALQENRLDLLSHWIAQDRLTVTEKLGDLIEGQCKGKNRTYLDMAESIYRSCFAHQKVVRVMVRQGLHRRALDYAKEIKLTTNEYAELLESYPSYQLGYALSQLKDRSGHPIVSLGNICRALVDSESQEIALQILQKLHLEGQSEDNSDKERSSHLREAVQSDTTTSYTLWNDLVKLAQEYGYEEVAIELLAAVTVSKAMKITREPSGLSEKSVSELNFSSAASSSLN